MARINKSQSFNASYVSRYVPNETFKNSAYSLSRNVKLGIVETCLCFPFIFGRIYGQRIFTHCSFLVSARTKPKYDSCFVILICFHRKDTLRTMSMPVSAVPPDSTGL